jgi:hypothetical protein
MHSTKDIGAAGIEIFVLSNTADTADLHLMLEWRNSDIVLDLFDVYKGILLEAHPPETKCLAPI